MLPSSRQYDNVIACSSGLLTKNDFTVTSTWLVTAGTDLVEGCHIGGVWYEAKIVPQGFGGMDSGSENLEIAYNGAPLTTKPAVTVASGQLGKRGHGKRETGWAMERRNRESEIGREDSRGGF